MLKTGKKVPRQNRSRDMVEAIFTAVTRILNRDGEQGLNTNKIASVAGISIGSLYQYFKNKESIFEELLLRMTEKNLKAMEEVVRITDLSTSSVEDLVRAVIDLHFDAFEEEKKLTLLIFKYAPLVLSPSYFKKSDEYMNEFLLRKMAQHPQAFRQQNQKEALFVSMQSIRATVYMLHSLEKSPEERMRIRDELAYFVSSSLRAD